MNRKLCLFIIVVTAYESQAYGHSALKGGSYSRSYSSSSASSAASSFSSSYSSGGPLNYDDLKNAGLAGSSAFAHTGAGAGAKATSAAGSWSGTGAVSGIGSVSGSGGCGGIICPNKNVGGAGGDAEEGINIIPGSGSKPGAYSHYPGASGPSNNAHYPTGQGTHQSSNNPFGGISPNTYFPSKKEGTPESSSHAGEYRPAHPVPVVLSSGSYKPSGAHETTNAGAYSTGQVTGPFPGPKGSIYDSKPAPPGGGGPDPAWLPTGSPTSTHSGSKISGLSPSLISSLPGAPGNIHSSKPAHTSGSSGSAFNKKPSSCGPNNPSCSYKPTAISGCSPSNPDCAINSSPNSGTHGTAGSGDNGGYYGGTYPGLSGSFSSSKPASSSTFDCSPSNPNCSKRPTSGNFNYPTSITGAHNTVGNSAGVISTVGHSAASSTGGLQKPTVAASYPGTTSNREHVINSLPGGPGTIHTSKPAPSSGSCGPSNPNCFLKPTAVGSYPTPSTSSFSNGGSPSGAPGTIYSKIPASSTNGCGPFNPNCSQKPTVAASYPGSTSNREHVINSLPGGPGTIHTSKPVPSSGSCGPSNPNCSLKPTVIGSYPAPSTGSFPNGGASTGAPGSIYKEDLFNTLPGAPGNIHTSKPAPPIGVESYPAFSNGAHSDTSSPVVPGSIHPNKPASSSDCGPFNPTCSNKQTKIPSYNQASPVTTGFSHVIHKLPGPNGSIHDSKPAPASGSQPVWPPLVHVVNPGATGNNHGGSSPSYLLACTKTGGCSGSPYSGTQSVANAAANAESKSGSLQHSYSGPNNKPSAQPTKPVYETSFDSLPASSDNNKPFGATGSIDSESQPQAPFSGPLTETPAYTSNPVVKPSSGVYQTSYDLNGPDSGSNPNICPFGSPDCSLKPSQPVDKPKYPSTNVESTLAYPGTGNLPVSGSTANLYIPNNQEENRQPVFPPLSQSKAGCVGNSCQTPGSGGYAQAGAGSGTFGNGNQKTYSGKPIVGCTSGTCSGRPSQPSSGCVGSDCGTGASGKSSNGYPIQPSSGNNYPTGVPSGCSGGNCGGGNNGYSGSPAFSSGDGFATGSVLIQKNNGDISYGTDNPKIYSYNGKQAEGCSGSSCGSSDAGSEGHSGIGAVGVHGSSGPGSSSPYRCSGSTCGSGGLGGLHPISGSYSGTGTAGGSGSGCGSGKCGGQNIPGFGGGFGTGGAFSSAGSGAGFGLSDILGTKGLNGAFSKAFSGTGSFAKAGAGATSYSGAISSSSSGSY